MYTEMALHRLEHLFFLLKKCVILNLCILVLFLLCSFKLFDYDVFKLVSGVSKNGILKKLVSEFSFISYVNYVFEIRKFVAEIFF